MKNKIIDLSFLKVWLTITIPIPLCLSGLLILFSFIIGIPDFSVKFVDIWSSFYITGHFLTVIAWKWHLVLMFLISLVLALTEDV